MKSETCRILRFTGLPLLVASLVAVLVTKGFLAGLGFGVFMFSLLLTVLGVTLDKDLNSMKSRRDIEFEELEERVSKLESKIKEVE